MSNIAVVPDLCAEKSKGFNPPICNAAMDYLPLGPSTLVTVHCARRRASLPQCQAWRPSSDILLSLLPYWYISSSVIGPLAERPLNMHTIYIYIYSSRHHRDIQPPLSDMIDTYISCDTHFVMLYISQKHLNTIYYYSPSKVR